MAVPLYRAASRPPARRPQGGVTLIELVGVVSMIAVLIGLLLPAVQAAREAASRESAVRTLRDLCTAGGAYERRTGRLPETLLELTGPEHPVSDGAHGGRHYTLRTSPGWSIVADPLPGVTGHESATVDADHCEPSFYPAPGAAEGRRRMVESLTVAGARAVADLMALAAAGDRNIALAEARAHSLRDETRRVVADTLADDGAITLASVDATLACDGSVHPFACDGSVRPIIQRFREGIRVALQFGAYDEDWGALPGVQPGVPSAQALFTADALVMLTTVFVHDRGLEMRLLGALREAARAEASGNEAERVAAIGQFLEGIIDGTSITDGTSHRGALGRVGAISTTDALTLEILARVWADGTAISRR